MPFFRGLGAKKNLPASGGALSPPALRLIPIQANHHAQMPLRKRDGVHGRLTNTR
jgi:hypothetical protein